MFGQDLIGTRTDVHFFTERVGLPGFLRGRLATTSKMMVPPSAESRFRCGSRQPLAGTESNPSLAARTTAKLVVAGTTELDASFQLQKDSNLVGRTDRNGRVTEFGYDDLDRYGAGLRYRRCAYGFFTRSS